jgi:hypothetical protein
MLAGLRQASSGEVAESGAAALADECVTSDAVDPAGDRLELLDTARSWSVSARDAART